MSSLSTALSALTTSQRALEIIGQNIANANTPGYHRQVANLATRYPTEIQGFSIGAGVHITDIRRLRNTLLETAVTDNTSELGNSTAQLEILSEIEAQMAPGESSIHDRLESFFNQLETLAARPDDATQRRIVLSSASSLGDEIRSLDGNFDKSRSNLDSQIRFVVHEINDIGSKIAQLNPMIQRAEIRGIDANDLRDQRDQLINELADRVGVSVQEHDDGQTSIFVAGAQLVASNQNFELAVSTDDVGQAVVTLSGDDRPLAIAGGKLGGLLQVRNKFLTDYQERLDSLARELMRGLGGVHATGIGLNGPLNFLSGHRAVSDVTIPLAAASLDFPPKKGSLFISVTDLSNGSQTLTELPIDPSTQSLQDLAAAIGSINHLQAIADSQTGTLTVMAAPGYAFDFAGRLQPLPDTSSITGTTVPRISGDYSGTSNDTFTFRVVGSGTVGVTPNLILRAENSSGTVLASLNIGQGYEPGSMIQVASGVMVQLSAGTANDGDTFSSTVVAEPDTAGILTALGLNSFFDGSEASDIRVDSQLLAHPELMAASRSGQNGDGSMLQKMAALRDSPLLANGTQNYREFFTSMVGDLGAQVQSVTQQKDHLELLGQRLEAERQSVSGVDPNEELVHMVQFQRSFQMAARYVTVVDEMLDSLFKII